MAHVKSAVRFIVAFGNDRGLPAAAAVGQARGAASAAAPAAAEGQPARAPRDFDCIPGPTTLPFLGLAAQAHLLPRFGVHHHAACPAWLENARARYGDVVRLGCSGDLPRRRARRRPALLLFQPRDMAQVYESGCAHAYCWTERSPLAEHRREVCPERDASPSGRGDLVFSSVARSALLSTDRDSGATSSSLQQAAQQLVDRLSGLQGRDHSAALSVALEAALHAWALESLAGALCSRAAPAHADLLRATRHVFAQRYAQRSERTLRDTPHYRDAVDTFRLHYGLCEEWLHSAEGRVASEELRSVDNGQRVRALSDLLLAGADALVHTGARLLYYLALNPAKQQHLRDELAACGGAGGGARYAAACVRETLRLYAPAALVRRSTATLEVAGYTIPPGIDIVLAHQISSRSDRQFGRASAFVPERWTCERGSPLHAGHAHPAATCPWGPHASAQHPQSYGGRQLELARSRAERESMSEQSRVAFAQPSVAEQQTDSAQPDGRTEGCPGRGLAERALSALASGVVAEHTVEWHGARAQLDTGALHHMPPPYHFVLQRA